MKKAKLTLTLNKETVANLNYAEMNVVKGGTEKSTEPSCYGHTCISHCYCLLGNKTNYHCLSNYTSCC